ncbi:hypothetical protein BT63DRAFT_159864 [Microthyrium microscopicum]|uniref:Transmembrane protein 135 N-terminal domain-containing protein n=1 Tax=Microthyrium microscopicum TaxID=703497 RepID=A0A6A6UPA7_9PEZI|nr:hypothetical protein BT63DRAFT_159864 [Microthyrium microscopicum]
MASVNSSASAASSGKPMDPVTLNAMRYSLSPKEYQLLHKYLLARTPVVQKKAPPPAKYERVVESSDDFNASTVRIALRLFGASYGGLKLWETLAPMIFARGKTLPVVKKPPFWKQTSVRLSASLSLILLFHRLLNRFLVRLRSSLLTDNAKPFRGRNPRISAALTSKLAPVIGSGLAGLFLGVYPAAQLRITITLYMFTRSLEFFYNYIEDLGYMKDRPWWFGSWLLMPASCGQLLHAFVFDRDCFPASYGNLIIGNSKTYLQGRPIDYPANFKWPTTPDIVDSLAEISRLKWPIFVSPSMFPNSTTLPKSLAAINPITSPAHPTIKNLSCALTHPHDPSCVRTYLQFFLEAFPGIVRYFSILIGAFSLLRIQAFIKTPIPAFSRLAQVILRNSIFVTGAIGTAWGSICLFQNIMPNKVLPTKRWILGGALGGMWAFIDRKNGRGNFLFSTRLSLDSMWKVGVKHGWWKGVRDGDVLLFTASLVAMQVIYELDPKAVNSPMIRKTLSLFRGDGFIDRAMAVIPPPAVLQERDAKQQSEPLLEKDESKKTA